MFTYSESGDDNGRREGAFDSLTGAEAARKFEVKRDMSMNDKFDEEMSAFVNELDTGNASAEDIKSSDVTEAIDVGGSSDAE